MATVEITKRTFKQKVSDTVNKAKETVNKGAQWVADNPDKVATFTITCVMATRCAFSILRAHDEAVVKSTERRKIWDPVMGQNLYSKKPLNGEQKLEFERLVAEGYGRAEALDSMGVLDMKR